MMTIMINIYWLTGIISVALAAGYLWGRKIYKNNWHFSQPGIYSIGFDPGKTGVTLETPIEEPPVETPVVVRNKKRRGRPRKKNNDAKDKK